jgi:cell division protein FtsZ
MGILTIGVVTKPFNFELQAKMNIALKGIAEMRKHIDALIIIPNQKLLSENDRGLGFKEAFEKADDVLYKVVKSLADVLNKTSIMNVDFSDLEAVLKDSGDAHIAIGVGTGDNKVEEAVEQVINCPLLETTIDSAKKMLVHVTLSADSTLHDVEDAVNRLTKVAHPDAYVKYGANIDNDLKDTIVIVVVATSFPPKDDELIPDPFSEPIETGSTQQLKDIASTLRGDPLPIDRTLDLKKEEEFDDPFANPFADIDVIFGPKK